LHRKVIWRIDRILGPNPGGSRFRFSWSYLKVKARAEPNPNRWIQEPTWV